MGSNILAMTKPRAGVIGFGFGGRIFHAPLLKAAGFDVVGIQATNPERVAQAKAAYPEAAIVATTDELIALGLDLQLRVKFDTHLDQLMRQMWLRYGKPEISYDAVALQKQLAEVSGDAKFADSFFKEQINQSQLPDFKALFAEFGLLLQVAEPNKAFAGPLSFRQDGSALIVASRPLFNSAWAKAGVGLGDHLLQLGEYPISSSQDVDLAMKNAKPGDKLAIKFSSKGEVFTSELLLSQDPRLELVHNTQASAMQIKRRNDWLSSQAVTLAVK